MYLIKIFDLCSLVILIIVPLVNSASVYKIPSFNSAYTHYNEFLTEPSQILVAFNFRTFDHHHDFLKNLSALPNLEKYFLKEGVQIEIATSSRKNEQTPVWLLNQLKNKQKSGFIGSFFNSKDNVTKLKRSVSFTSDLNNQLSWLKRIDILMNWLTNNDTSQRINFGVINFSEDEKHKQLNTSDSSNNEYDLLISYFINLLTRAGILNKINIILVTG